MLTVPTGAWQRDWIRRGGGAPDARVTVRYVQTPSAFGDLRIPADRPDLSRATSLAELSDEQLAALAHQNGFAGFTTIDGANATWHHEIDFQPAGDGPDVGRIEPAGQGRMFEHALDDSYVESWSALGGGGGATFAARVERAGRVDQLLAVAGEHFVYARARPVPLPPGESISALIASGHPARDTVIAYLDCEISYGTTRGWRIERSTLPWQQGKRLGFADRIAIDAEGRSTPRAVAEGERWSFPATGSAAGELRAMFTAGR
ncbi:MAG TPA: hypothetical protein VFT22_02190 [Kofleriaceae bacterium]|nr:hypothetical protein [Kofleriaceae bacterium]